MERAKTFISSSHDYRKRKKETEEETKEERTI